MPVADVDEARGTSRASSPMRRQAVACARPFEPAEQTALAFYERDCLSAYATGFTWPRSTTAAFTARLLGRMFGPPAAGALSRRTVPTLPAAAVRSFVTIDLGRTVASALGLRGLEDRLWERDDHRFSQLAAERVLPACDTIHGIEHASLELFQAAKASGRATVLHIASVHPTFHDEIFDRAYREHPEFQESLAWRLRERRLRRDARRIKEYELADLLVTWSRFSSRSLTTHGVPADRVVIVPLGAAPVPPLATPAPGDMTRSGPLRVMFAGKISFHKGCHVLLEAWSLFDSRDAVLVLAGHNELPPALTAARGVELAGSLPQAGLFSLMNQCDLLVLPTLSDSFGMVVTEALMHGLPVLTTANAGAADLIVEGRTGWIVPAGDAVALCARLRWCEANLAEVRGMRERVRGSVTPRTWSDYRADLRTTLRERDLL